MVLLSFIVTDYTDSIKCKLFLRYRASRFKGGEEDIAITEDGQGAGTYCQSDSGG